MFKNHLERARIHKRRQCIGSYILTFIAFALLLCSMRADHQAMWADNQALEIGLFIN